MKIPTTKQLRIPFLCFAALAALMVFPASGFSAELHLDGSQLSLPWVIPFACMLLSIALGPLVVPHFWHHHYGKVAAFWGLAFLVPFALTKQFGPQLAFYEFLHAMLLEYIPFIMLLFALFTVSGGIRLKGRLVGTPRLNLAILFIGTVLASWMGTTGAAMLLIRPLLRANAHRRYKVHTIVFFIFLVANIGGSLTPLGDPPLFLGFLQGVDFFWTLTHMMPVMLFMCACLFVIYFVLDTVLYGKEVKNGLTAPVVEGEVESFGIEGGQNFILLACVVGAVLMSGIWQPGNGPTVYGVHLEWQNIARDLILLCIAGASLAITRKETRLKNEFTWEPIAEVAKLFFGIFLSMIPAIAILKAGDQGALAPLVRLVNEGGQPQNAMYFWLTGALSSFLDNAPTYLVFFNTAGGALNLAAGQTVAGVLMTDLAPTLLAISAGAVFMGANTYIGNAPNFMVRSIAEGSGVKMPSFFGYMAWSVGILVPLFVVLTLIFF